MVTIDELFECALEQGYGKLRKGSKRYMRILDIHEKEFNKDSNKALRSTKERCSKKIICTHCKRQIMYKNDCVSYYDPMTKTNNIFHFSCQFKK